MRRPFIAWTGIWLLYFLVADSRAQQDRLQGRWEGTVQSIQGERQAKASFKKEGNSYTGTISGMRGDIPFKEIKVEGDKIAAKAEVESAQGTLVINFEFNLQGEDLKGKGDVDFSGQTFSFTYDLKRVGDLPAEGTTTPAQTTQQQAPQQAPQRTREPVPQPIQQQSLNYFLGQWKFKWTGKESPLGPGGPREGVVTYTPILDGKFLECRTEGKSEAGRFEEIAFVSFDPEKKVLTSFENRSGGAAILGLGDWASPIGIRFTLPPIKVKGQTLNLKRTISIVAAHSYTVTEELSIDSGPFQRLGNGLFTKIESKVAKE